MARTVCGNGGQRRPVSKACDGRRLWSQGIRVWRAELHPRREPVDHAGGGPSAESGERRRGGALCGQVCAGEECEPGPGAVGHGGHPTEEEPAAHHAPARPQHNVETGAQPDIAASVCLQSIAVASADAQCSDVGQVGRQLVLRDMPRRAFGGYRRRHLTVPTLLLVGSRDFALSPRSVTDAGWHADELTVRVLDGGHYLPEERPNMVASAVREMARPKL
jgi:pimeloyl-ACP methyl ester carboxylesterase